jgi:hypothetical protein
MDKSLAELVSERLYVESSRLTDTLEDEPAQAVGDKNDRSVDRLNSLSASAQDGN